MHSGSTRAELLYSLKDPLFSSLFNNLAVPPFLAQTLEYTQLKSSPFDR